MTSNLELASNIYDVLSGVIPSESISYIVDTNVVDIQVKGKRFVVTVNEVKS